MTASAFLFKAHGFFRKIAGDLLDIAADIADLGKFGGFNLDKRCVGKLCQAARYLGLAATCRPDHQDIFGRHLIAQIIAQTLTPPAIAQRNCYGALCVRLANNMFVESSHNGFWGQCVFHYRLDGKLRTAFK